MSENNTVMSAETALWSPCQFSEANDSTMSPASSNSMAGFERSNCSACTNALSPGRVVRNHRSIGDLGLAIAWYGIVQAIGFVALVFGIHSSFSTALAARTSSSATS